MVAATTPRRTMVSAENTIRESDLEFDYATWARKVKEDTDRINKDPHAYLKEEARKDRKASIRGFLQFLKVK